MNFEEEKEECGDIPAGADIERLKSSKKTRMNVVSSHPNGSFLFYSIYDQRYRQNGILTCSVRSQNETKRAFSSVYGEKGENND